jgi:hypothetical protein
MSVIINGDTGVTTPGVVNTAGETIATTLSVTGVTTLTGGLNAALPVLSGGTGVTTKTGTGAVVLGTSPTITGATITVAATAAPAFSAYSNANQTIPQSTFTKVLLQLEEFDTNSNFDNTTNYRFTPTVAGYYQTTGGIGFTTAQAVELAISLYKNGSEFKRVQDTVGIFGVSGSALIYCNGSTDYLEMYLYTANAGTRVLQAGSQYTYFQAAMIRSA